MGKGRAAAAEIETEETENVPGETKEAKFRRLATQRTKNVLKGLRILGNCSSRASYAYGQVEIDKIFGAIEVAIKDTHAKFKVGEIEEVEEVDGFGL